MHEGLVKRKINLCKLSLFYNEFSITAFLQPENTCTGIEMYLFIVRQQTEYYALTSILNPIEK